ncbi:MAG: tetratricopeptide repeat protein [Methylohalobius sp. ZOD2]|nr:tetratricopeptide repeat protein [Methylothermaceae bacterium]
MARCFLILIGLMAWGSAWTVPTGFKWVPESSLPQARQGNEYYLEGLERLVAGDLAAANQAFRENVQHYPRAANAMLGLAEIAFQRNQIKEAGTWINKAVEIAPDNPHAQTSLGRYLRLTGRFKEAQDAFRKAAEFGPDMAEPWIALGDLYLTVFNKPKQAVEAYQTAVVIDSNLAAAHYALGVAQFRLGDHTGAVTELRKAGELEPENPLPHLELARIYLNLQKPTDALTSVGEALRIQPGLLEAGLLRGDILSAQGNVAQAEATYTQLAERHPKSAAPRLHLAMLYQQLGRREGAIDSYRSAIAIDPQLAPAYNNLAGLLGEQKQYLAEAEALAAKAVALTPQVAHFHDTLGWIYHKEGKLTESYQALGKAARMAPNDPAIAFHWVTVLADCGDRREAIVQLERALKQSDRFPGAAEATALLNSLRNEERTDTKPKRSC